VDAGVFHDFHTAWLIAIRTTLNGGLLPNGYYALAEQSAGIIGPDVLTLERRRDGDSAGEHNDAGGKVATLAPPKVKYIYHSRRNFYARKQRRMTIRHRSGDRLVAVVEIVSPGNKASAAALRKFVEKAEAVFLEGVHLLVVDIFPPTRRDPQGVHGAIWSECGEEDYKQSKKKPLTVAAYDVAGEITAYVEPFAVGDTLPEMPLFLDAQEYVDLPLQSTYDLAWVGLPKHIQQVLIR